MTAIAIPPFAWLFVFLMASSLVHLMFHAKFSNLPCFDMMSEGEGYSSSSLRSSFLAPGTGQSVAPQDAHLAEHTMLQELYDAISKERLSEIVKQYKEEYANGKPFPHIAIDGIFPERILKQVLKENPESMIVDGCVKGSELCYRKPKENKKSAITDESHMGLVWYFHSESVL